LQYRFFACETTTHGVCERETEAIVPIQTLLIPPRVLQ